MPRINEATDTDLKVKVIEELTGLGWKRGDLIVMEEKINESLRN